MRVRGWDRPEVKVDAVKYAYTRERLEEARIEVDATAQSVHIKTRYPYRSTTWTSDREGRRNNPATVEYVLTVPRGALISQIELINGALDMEGLTGDVRASSINGKVTARDLTGPVRLSTINGPGGHLRGLQPSGHARLRQRARHRLPPLRRQRGGARRHRARPSATSFNLP